MNAVRAPRERSLHSRFKTLSVLLVVLRGAVLSLRHYDPAVID